VISRGFSTRYLAGTPDRGVRVDAASGGNTLDIVGVAGDTWSAGRSSTLEPTFYSNMLNRRWTQSTLWLLARARTETAPVTRDIRALIQTIDPRIVAESVTLDEQLASVRQPVRFYALVLGAIAIGALALAAIGVAVGIRQMVQERMREIGVRIALGATPSNITWLIVSRVLSILCVGTGLGAAVGLAGVQGFRTVLFEMEQPTVTTFVLAVVALATLVLPTSVWPAIVATRVDPSVVWSDE
jgi:hypothetical protein